MGHFNKCSGAHKPNMFQNRSWIFQQNSAPAKVSKLHKRGLKIMCPNLLVVNIGHQPAKTLVLCYSSFSPLRQGLLLSHPPQNTQQSLYQFFSSFWVLSFQLSAQYSTFHPFAERSCLAPSSNYPHPYMGLQPSPLNSNPKTQY